MTFVCTGYLIYIFAIFILILIAAAARRGRTRFSDRNPQNTAAGAARAYTRDSRRSYGGARLTDHAAASTDRTDDRRGG